MPVGAVIAAASVRVLEVAAGFGLNDGVTPLGTFEAEKLTLLTKPLCGVTLTVVVPFCPCVTLTLLGDAESKKFPTIVTVSAVAVELVMLPEVPVIVRFTVPVAAELAAVRVRTLEVMVGFGLNEAVTPLGRPETDKVTPPLKPFTSVMPMVPLTVLPWVTVMLLGADMVKPGAVLGQALTKFAALMLPSPVAKSHPAFVP